MGTVMELARDEAEWFRRMYMEMSLPALMERLEQHRKGMTLLPSSRDALAWVIQAKLRAEAEHASRAASNADEAGGHGEAVAPGWYP